MRRLSFVVASSLVALVACAMPRSVALPAQGPPVDIGELWEAPDDLLTRDLLAGPGGTAAPPNNAPFQFVAHKSSGKNPGYDVRDSNGRPWSVKLGEEAQPEVTASRILWAMGFHQPPSYFVREWTLTGEDAGRKTHARFRADDDAPVVGEWSWYENPFVGTRPFGGLVVAMMILNNWDLKTSNNKVYAGRRFIVRDLGASLSGSKQSPIFKFLRLRHKQGSKNDLAGFEAQGFIRDVDGSRVRFDYRGLDSRLLDIVTPADIVWACELLARLPDGHWEAAFRAGGYAPDETNRYVRKIKEKINQGLALNPGG